MLLKIREVFFIEKLMADEAWSRNKEQVQKKNDVDPEQIICHVGVPRKDPRADQQATPTATFALWAYRPNRSLRKEKHQQTMAVHRSPAAVRSTATRQHGEQDRRWTVQSTR